eukprot:UN26414
MGDYSFDRGFYFSIDILLTFSIWFKGLTSNLFVSDIFLFLSDRLYFILYSFNIVRI